MAVTSQTTRKSDKIPFGAGKASPRDAERRCVGLILRQGGFLGTLPRFRRARHWFPFPVFWRLLMLDLSRSRLVFVMLATSLAGCGWHPHGSLAGPDLAALPGLQNPMLVTVADRDVLWDQVSDTLDNYFTIQREERVRQVGDVLLEGRFETFPVGGATALEPWRKDATHGFERAQSTLQSIRRRATVRVTPTSGGYLIDVAVYKELEDLASPQHATVGRARVRHETTLERNDKEPGADIYTLGWIPLGRDVSLEQRILQEIRERTTGP